jgi:hypothetical protein
MSFFSYQLSAVSIGRIFQFFLSVSLSLCLSGCLCVFMCIPCPSFSLSISISFPRPTYLSIYLSFFQCNCGFVSLFFVPVYRSIGLYVYVSVYSSHYLLFFSETLSFRLSFPLCKTNKLSYRWEKQQCSGKKRDK